jgi:hypothetical protein
MGRRTVAIIAAAVAAVVIAVVLAREADEGARELPAALQALSYDPARRAQFERDAAQGLSHVLYAKSPGGAEATAARTARWRPQVEAAARGAGLDPDTLEAIVFLESAGRPDAQASNDLEGAAGLTQILAQTATGLLGMKVDVRASQRLTRGIRRGHRVRARRAARRRVDERFDPAKALAATARYLTIASGTLHRDDLAVVSYHMGIGNLQRALAAYGEPKIPYAQLYFDSSPFSHESAWRVLSGLGDDSSTYLWRIGAAREIMRLYREDPAELDRLQALHARKNSAEEVLHPRGTTPDYPDPFALARAKGELLALDPAELRSDGLSIDPRMGELAPHVHQSPRLYRALRPQALATLETIGAATMEIAKATPLVVTSTVRDRSYQRALVRTNAEATRAFSLHTTGWAFDIERRYRSRAQALAFQFVLDRLTARNRIAWVREPAAIHITAAGP